MKKTLAKILALCMLASTLTVGVPLVASATLSADNNRYLEENFDDGSYDASLITAVMDGTNLSVENGALKVVTPTNTNVRYRINAKDAFQNAPAGKQGKLTYQFDIKVVNNTGNADRCPVARDVSTNWGTATNFITMKPNQAIGSSSATIPDATATEGVWYRVKLVFDYTGESLTFDAYANGTKVRSAGTIANSYDPYDLGVGFATHIGESESGLTYYIDNLKIAYVEVDEPNAFYNEVFTEDFDSLTTISGHSFVGSKGVGALADATLVTEAGRGKVLKAACPASGQAWNRVFFYSPKLTGAGRTSGTAIYEFDIKMVDNSDGTTNNVNKGTSAVSYGFFNGGSPGMAGRMDIKYNQVVNYSAWGGGTKSTNADDWNTIKLVCDYSGSAWVYDIYVNGTLWKENQTESTYDPFTTMFFYIAAGPSTGKLVDYYLDNVTVGYVEADPEILSGISVAGVNVANFDATTTSYTADIPESDFASLSGSDVSVTFASGFSAGNTTVTKTVSAVGDTKVVTVTLESGIYAPQTYTVTCSEALEPNAAYNEHLTENFDSLSNLTGHAFISTGGGITSIEEEAGRGKVLKRTYPESSNNNVRTYLNASSLEGASRKVGTLTYEFDMKVEDASDGTNNVYKGGYGVAYGFHVISGDTVSERFTVRYNRVDTGALENFGIASEDWNHFKIVYDYSGDTLTYDVYVNGTLFKENLTESTYDAFDKMAFHFWGADNGRKLTYYLDNVDIAYREGAEAFTPQGLTLTSAGGTSYSLTGSVRNTMGAAKTYTLILAGYDGTELKGLDFYENQVAPRGEIAINKAFDLGTTEATTYMAFAWSSFTGLIPLCEGQSLTLE